MIYFRDKAKQLGCTLWETGYPLVGEVCIFHIPLKGYPDYMVLGVANGGGYLCDLCGDDLGYGVDDIEKWAYLGGL